MGEENESKHGGCEEHVGQWVLLMSLVIQSVGVDEEVRGETLNLYSCDGSPRFLMLWTIYPFITLVCPRIFKKLPDRYPVLTLIQLEYQENKIPAELFNSLRFPRTLDHSVDHHEYQPTHILKVGADHREPWLGMSGFVDAAKTCRR